MNYSYISTAGYEVTVPSTLHKMIQRGVDVGHVNGGKLTKNCKFVVSDGIVKVEPAKKVPAVKVTAKTKVKVSKPAKVVKAVKTAGTKSNADLIRERIAQAKAAGETIDAVIAYGINELGQNKSQAQIYAKNNWDKV